MSSLLCGVCSSHGVTFVRNFNIVKNNHTELNLIYSYYLKSSHQKTDCHRVLTKGKSSEYSAAIFSISGWKTGFI